MTNTFCSDRTWEIIIHFFHLVDHLIRNSGFGQQYVQLTRHSTSNGMDTEKDDG